MELINKKEALVDLANRMQKQIAETEWEIKRIEPLSQKEFEKLQGVETKKEVMIKLLQDKLEERKKNYKVTLKMINENEKTNN
jgi:hypothetical protein